MEVIEDDGQTAQLGGVYRLESIVMPFAVWNGEQFVGPRERFHLRLLETLPRRDGGWIQLVGHIDGVPLVAEINHPLCETCGREEGARCASRGHILTDEAVPNRALLAAIDEVTAPWLEADAEARAADDTDEILTRAYRWEASHGTAYSPSQYERGVLERRLRQLADHPEQRKVIERRFPTIVATHGETTPLKSLDNSGR